MPTTRQLRGRPEPGAQRKGGKHPGRDLSLPLLERLQAPSEEPSLAQMRKAGLPGGLSQLWMCRGAGKALCSTDRGTRGCSEAHVDRTACRRSPAPRRGVRSAGESPLPSPRDPLPTGGAVHSIYLPTPARKLGHRSPRELVPSIDQITGTVMPREPSCLLLLLTSASCNSGGAALRRKPPICCFTLPPANRHWVSWVRASKVRGHRPRGAIRYPDPSAQRTCSRTTQGRSESRVEEPASGLADSDPKGSGSLRVSPAPAAGTSEPAPRVCAASPETIHPEGSPQCAVFTRTPTLLSGSPANNSRVFASAPEA